LFVFFLIAISKKLFLYHLELRSKSYKQLSCRGSAAFIVLGPKLCEVITFFLKNQLLEKKNEDGRIYELSKRYLFLSLVKSCKIIDNEAKEGLMPSYFKKNIVRMDLDLCFYRRLKITRLKDQKIKDSCVVA